MFISSLLLPKQGSTRLECEDALEQWPSSDSGDEVTGDFLVAAISDGASESALAKDWSKMLVRDVVARASADRDLLGGPTAGFAGLVAELVDNWERHLYDYVKRRNESDKPVQWYEEPKFERGAFATLLAVQVERSADTGVCSWQAAALGDSCLFQVRDGRLLISFPLSDPRDFGTTPNLFGSRNRDSELIVSRTHFTSGTVEQGDCLLMMTDALAAWFLSLGDGLPEELVRLTDFSRQNDLAGFETWVTSLRVSGQLHNDDVALVHIDV